MKHTLKVTILILGLFLLAHIIGLFLVYAANPVVTTTSSTGETITIHETKETPGIGKITPVSNPYIPILIGVLLGTGIMLLLIRFKKFMIMKSWHFFGIAVCLYISFYTLFDFFFPLNISYTIVIIVSLILSVGLSIFRTFKPNIYVHNITELFIYGGIAVLFCALFKTPDMKSASILYASILLIGISIYDAIAVWQSRHMITLAKSQTEQKVFAGIFIPYKRKSDDSIKIQKDIPKVIYGRKLSLKSVNNTVKKEGTKIKLKSKSSDNLEEQKSAILGGGDIAFTLLFSAVVLLSSYSFLKAAIVSVITTASLGLLLIYAKKDTFYPAMPFLSAGCFIGLLIVNLF